MHSPWIPPNSLVKNLEALQSLASKPNAILATNQGVVGSNPAGRTYLEVKVLYSPGKGKS